MVKRCTERMLGNCAFALFLYMFATTSAYANTGNIQIDATGADGRPLPGVSVIVQSRTGAANRASTDDTGAATLQGLNSGLYRITATRKGYVDVVEPSVRIVRDKTIPFRLRMREAVQTLEEVVVVADAISGDPFGAVSNTYMDREELRTAVGSGSDVLRALDGMPGLISTGEFANFTVRGRGPRDNLILVDGIPFDKVVHFDESLGEQEDIAGGGRFSIFPPTFIESAEFSPGGWSSAHGGRNGSLLKLDVARGNPSPSASFRIDLAGYELIYDGPSGIHEDTSMIFTARRFDFGEFFDTIDELDIGEPVMTDIILKTHTQLNDSNELEFLALYTPETNDRDATHVLQSDDFEDRELIDSEQDSALFGITWRRLFGSDSQWENKLYIRDSDKTSRQGEAFPNSTPMLMPANLVPVREDILIIEELETEIGWRSDLTTSNNWGVFSVGLHLADLDLELDTTLNGDWIRYEFDSTDFRADPTQNFIVLTPADTNSSFKQSELQYAVYAEQTFESGDWDFRTGVRYDYDGFSDEGYVSPRMAASYQISPHTRISATAGTFYQSPRFLDRAADLTNFQLENERTDHVSIGISHQFGASWDVLIEGYYQKLDDLVTEADAVTGRATNDGEGRSYGVDVVLDKRFDNGWSANAVYSYNDAELDEKDGTGKYDAPFNHEHMFSLGARWEINERWMIGFRWKYATGRPRDNFIVHTDVLAGLGGPLRFAQEFTNNGTRRWDDFHQLNLRVDYRRPIGPVDFIAFLDIVNVYGAELSDQREFNPVTGALVLEDGEVTPLIGIRFEKTWL